MLPNRPRRGAELCLCSYPVVPILAIKHLPTGATAMSSFGTFGIFLLLADSGEMGPDCRLLSGCFLVFVGITDLIPLANSQM